MDTHEIESFYAKSTTHWRRWLQKNHNKKKAVWLICYKKDAGMPTIKWSEAVDQALCFGWIDSKRKPIDDKKFIQYFCRRKKSSAWSKINKAKVKRLIHDGLMKQAGLDCIEAAKKNGSWSVLDAAEELTIPADLTKAFRRHANSKKYFSGLSRSNKKIILLWIALAKREETRHKRIEEVAMLASQGLMPKQFR